MSRDDGEGKIPPITPMDYLHGLTVVDIGDLRVARGETRRPKSSCTHRSLIYDNRERRVWCNDCESEIDPFDAFTLLAEKYDSALKGLKRRQNEVEEAESFSLRSRAAKKMDEYWRRRNMAPCCPHCGGAFLPEDALKIRGWVSKELEIKRRQQLEKK